MRINKAFLLLLLAFSFLACRNNWNEEDKEAFYQSCTEEAMIWAGTPETAKTYCDCVFGKMQQKYPNEQDALEHIDVLAKDTDLINCKEEILKNIKQ